MASMNILNESIQAPTRNSRKIHDPSISFEEYLHFAAETRNWESSAANATTLSGPTGLKAALRGHSRLEKKTHHVAAEDTSIDGVTRNEKSLTGGEAQVSPASTNPSISDDEWSTAARAGRTATWGAVFFLMTTDILGPFSVP